MRLSMRRISAITAAMAASPLSGSSAHSCTYTRVPMIASSRSSQAADAGGAKARAAIKTASRQQMRVFMAPKPTTSATLAGGAGVQRCSCWRAFGVFWRPQNKAGTQGELPMNVSKLNGLICGALLSAALLAAPAITLAQDASTGTGTTSTAPLPTCKDGTTATKAGKGGCKGHGGVAKTTAAGTSTAAPAAGAAAAAPAAASSSSSSGATVTCKDGTTSTKTGRGACSGHGGVNKSAGGAASTATTTAPAAAAAGAAAAPATAAAAAKSKT